MKANIVDLRYKMNDILKALDRNESVTVFYHGKKKGMIIPARDQIKSNIKDHPFFGMTANEKKVAVLDELKEIRKPGYNDI